MTAYRAAVAGDDLTDAVWRPTAHGPVAWVPATPLGWQDERPAWLRFLSRLFGGAA